MTTNVPQDVIEELEKISQDIASAGINGFGNRISDAVSKLRDHRAGGEAVEDLSVGAFYNGIESERRGIKEVYSGIVDGKFQDCPPEWDEKPFCRIEWQHDSGDSDVGIPEQSGWCFAEDQAGTVLAELASKQTQPTLDYTAGMMKAAEICEGVASERGSGESYGAAKVCAEEILSAIPADAEAALLEVCMKVAKATWHYLATTRTGAYLTFHEYEAIVNSVLEGKS